MGLFGATHRFRDSPFLLLPEKQTCQGVTSLSARLHKKLSIRHGSEKTNYFNLLFCTSKGKHSLSLFLSDYFAISEVD